MVWLRYLSISEFFDVGIVQNFKIKRQVSDPCWRAPKVPNFNSERLGLNGRETVGWQRLRNHWAIWNKPSAFNINENFCVIGCGLGTISSGFRGGSEMSSLLLYDT